MTLSDSSGGSRRSGGRAAALTGVDRLFGRDLRSQGWVLKRAPAVEPRAASAPGLDAASESDPDPAMIWALKWRRR